MTRQPHTSSRTTGENGGESRPRVQTGVGDSEPHPGTWTRFGGREDCGKVSDDHDCDDETDVDWDVPFPEQMAAEAARELWRTKDRGPQEMEDDVLADFVSTARAFGRAPSEGLTRAAARALQRLQQRAALRRQKLFAARYVMPGVASGLARTVLAACTRGRSRAPRRGTPRKRRAGSARAAPASEDGPPPPSGNNERGSGIRTWEASTSREVGRA